VTPIRNTQRAISHSFPTQMPVVVVLKHQEITQATRQDSYMRARLFGDLADFASGTPPRLDWSPRRSAGSVHDDEKTRLPT